ncbi:tripartite motif-containing protein 5 [Dasypus novemcinctus]|uniref:tripartite motif-containing protein 5 n=1 Tax=Dasypus novemcinctus TaxID=9361 RepID=UPI0039C8F104
MTSAVLVDIRDEVTCPICLDLLMEPLSIDCGHSFCQACITGNSKQSQISQEGESSCPVCRTSYQPDNLRPNRHLANIVERLREVVLGPGRQSKLILCAQHGEKLQLFCKEDGKVICWLCERSQEHRGHHTFLMEEVAQEYQEKFQKSLKKLRKEQQDTENLQAVIREKKTSWKNQMEPERHRIQSQFNQLRSILDKEEQRELKKLEKEERKGLNIIEEAEDELVQQSQSLRELISDLEHRCQGSTMELLQDVSDVTTRSEFWTLKKPKALPSKLRSAFRVPDLKKMLRVFRELTDVQSYWVDVTLNPHTANLNLILSKNRRQVRFVGPKMSEPYTPKEHFASSVLGSQHFSSGKRYWEVDVAKKTAWVLGVCSESVGAPLPFNQYAGSQHAHSRFRPQGGYWVIGLQHKHEYRAYEDTASSLILSIPVPPRRIGIFLDYEAGTVSFYNVTNHGFPIYTFSKYYFPTPLCPYFNPCTCVVPMTLRRPRNKRASEVRTARSRGAAAMASEILVDIKEEVTCPICLDFMTEPLSIDCGHSFCQACITGNSKQSQISQEGESSCPVCRTSYQHENLHPNRHLANIVEKFREVELGPGKQPKLLLCAQHGEKLQLFCKEDEKVICWLCERSREHRGHPTFLLEEVAKEYQETLQTILERLRTDQKEAETLETDIKKERALWKSQIQNEGEHIQAEFKKLRGVLNSEEQRELQKLKTEKEKVLDTLAKEENDLIKQSQLLRALISDVEHHLQGSSVEMLQDVHGILRRSKSLTLKKPISFQNKQRSIFRAPDLSGILRVFKELRDVQCYWVHMTLNPVTTNSNIVISKDRRQMRSSASLNSQRMRNYVCDILGSHMITSGKHYWEVDVSQKRSWFLGVKCGKQTAYSNFGSSSCQTSYFTYGSSASCQTPFPEFGSSAHFHNDYSRYQPRYGYWVIGLQNQYNYNAFEDSSSSDPSILTLFLTVRPCRVGVFIDYKSGIVSFFNITNCGFLIYKFSDCVFSGTVFPYFNPTSCRGPMTLCPPSS